MVSIAVATCLFTLGVSACSSAGEGSTPTTDASTTTTTTVPLTEPPTLLDAGAAPHRALRYAFAEGDEVRIHQVTDLVIDQVADGQHQRLDSPPIEQTLVLRVAEVGPKGARVHLEIEGASIDPEGTDLTESQITATRGLLEALDGLTGEVVIDELGRVVESSFEVPDDADPAVQQTIESMTHQMRQFAPALPVDPVGVGATWRAETAMSQVGTVPTGTGTTTFTTTAIEGTRVSFEAETAIAIPAQDVDSDDGTVQLRPSSSTGSETGWFDLASPTKHTESHIDGEQVVEVEMDGRRVPLAQTYTVVIRSEPNTP